MQRLCSEHWWSAGQGGVCLASPAADVALECLRGGLGTSYFLRCLRGRVVWRRACRERLAPGLECCRSAGRS
eukprot:scaffold2507_cov122-Isochrysis_galbana.AAC.12